MSKEYHTVQRGNVSSFWMWIICKKHEVYYWTLKHACLDFLLSNFRLSAILLTYIIPRGSVCNCGCISWGCNGGGNWRGTIGSTNFNHLKLYTSVALSTFTMCATITTKHFQNFLIFPIWIYPFNNNYLFSPPPQLLATIILLLSVYEFDCFWYLI